MRKGYHAAALARRTAGQPNAVNLKFPSPGWQARGRNLKFENHTGTISLLVQLSNPKLALRDAPKVMRISDSPHQGIFSSCSGEDGAGGPALQRRTPWA